ncbi:nucleotidyltransferase domain-containing protein [Rubrivirga sp. S365]|uniref:nucleotidyltransferase domain-containing protein n=1 Tax=Rubrivirga sp. S365 TaxID=3076080 RepID=UPI0028C76BAB|nr:nucleotidyltransferase domain-containing protein [Rubrivirga sp. S365]MDT7857486.1 nucleotidyltransferase domain-containing protein [Rubrivirga sp. S365]
MLPDSTPPRVRAAIADAKARLEALYGDRLDRLVLYGSRARGDARPDSDVDLLVVLRGAYEPYAELKRTAVLRLELSIEHGEDVSMQPYGADEVAADVNSFLRAATGEGVAL